MSSVSCISHFLPLLDRSHLVQSDISPIIEALKQEAMVNVQLVGRSYEKRPIHLLTLGNGPSVIFAWTQMHGNEATATASVFDLIDTLLSKPPASLSHWKSIFTIHILPMLNPDGAQRCIRQNAQGIDINRDARELQTPEGKILMQMVEQLAPDIGFNLHDQSSYYQCGNTGNPATIAFLAPAFDEQKTIDQARERAMMLIAHMTLKLQPHISDCVARYDDTYSPRSFGDNIAARNVSTILIESGAARQDSNRQIARAMNVLAMTSAFEFIYESSITDQKQATVTNYFSIPENVSEALSSLVIKNLSFGDNLPYKAGISVKQTARYSNVFFIDFVGDLGIQAGLVEFDGAGLTYNAGKVFTVALPTALNNQSYIDLLRQGFLYFDDPNDLLSNLSDFDIKHSKHSLGNANAFILDQAAYCLFADSNEPSNIIGAMLNGQLIWFR
jgi:hypothetical protein